MDEDSLLDAIRTGHAPIEAAVAALTDADLLADAPGMPGWTRKDVLAHIEWWHEHSSRTIEGARTGTDPYPDDGESWDIDTWNARILRESRDRPAADVRTGEAASFTRLLALVEGATGEELFIGDPRPWLKGTVAAIVIADSADHYPEHVPHLG